MLVVVSPAKNLDFETPIKVDDFTQPTMLQDTERLMEVCRTLSPADLSSLMKISDKLATLNAIRFAELLCCIRIHPPRRQRHNMKSPIKNFRKSRKHSKQSNSRAF